MYKSYLDADERCVAQRKDSGVVSLNVLMDLCDVMLHFMVINGSGADNMMDRIKTSKICPCPSLSVQQTAAQVLDQPRAGQGPHGGPADTEEPQAATDQQEQIGAQHQP